MCLHGCSFNEVWRVFISFFIDSSSQWQEKASLLFHTFCIVFEFPFFLSFNVTSNSIPHWKNIIGFIGESKVTEHEQLNVSHIISIERGHNWHYERISNFVWTHVFQLVFWYILEPRSKPVSSSFDYHVWNWVFLAIFFTSFLYPHRQPYHITQVLFRL